MAPPKYGLYEIAVEQICLSEMNKNMIHFCCDACNRFTLISNDIIPAVYTILPAEKWRQCNYLEFVKIKVNEPIHFYFTDEANVIFEDKTPIIRLVITYLELCN